MQRERITISVSKKLLENVDRAIDGQKLRNRSHAFESLTLKGLGQTETNKAVILLGGDNAMKSIPNTIKILESLKKMGFMDIHIAVGFLGDKVKAKLGNGEEYGLNFIYSDKGEGSGGALSILKKELAGTFVVVNHNRFDDLKIENLLAFHKKHGSIATIATDDLSDYLGVYVLEPEIIKYLPRGFSMLEDDIFPKIIKEGKAIVCPVI